ncbi:ABC transporter ATP-binding protein [Vibrio ostreicida]|uniref:ABC transporter ATP-binding protein n=1 Tax=Vibrio ostreicida TaxID=526588 RepID=A0ABT8BPV9_9VIBR|nr:ABC transporter ATP-binding protein [Vibrio ostreicida]MDN3608481.1 ABC transporter ATP-binding protein [Vibrio ostreicida]NPD10303.1 ABC transporter ATP-binding protein [Vibrio ostreicida]
MLAIIRNVFSILLVNKKKDFYVLVVLMFLLSILELIGLGVLIPVISTLSDPGKINNNEYFVLINELLGFSGEHSAIFLMLFFLVAFYILKAISTLVIIFKQQVFVNRMFTDLSVNILSHNMSLKFSEFKNKDTSSYLKDIVSSSAYLSLCTFNILQLVTETFVLLSIIVFLYFYVGLVKVLYLLSAVLVLGWLFKSVTRNISFYGQQRDSVMHEITKSATEALNGYREIRNNDVLENVIGDYEKKADPYVDIYAKFGTMIYVPKVTLESLAALGIIVYIFYVFYMGLPMASVMQNLIIFSFVGLRTIPSFSKLLNALAQIRYFGSESEKFKTLFLDSGSKYVYNGSVDDFSESIEFKNISFKYPGSVDKTLDRLSFKIEKNKKYGFVGQSGSGKSTLFDIILGLSSPESGTICIDGHHYSTLEDINVTKLVGVVSQDFFILDGSLKSNVLFFSEYEDKELFDSAIEGAQLREFVEKNKDGLVGENGSNLSGGQKQRLAIARSLYANKSILLLDEATSALDNSTERQFINYLNNKNDHTVLTIAHRLTTVKDCDEIFVFKNGRIVDAGNFINLSETSVEFKRLLNSGDVICDE